MIILMSYWLRIKRNVLNFKKRYKCAKITKFQNTTDLAYYCVQHIIVSILDTLCRHAAMLSCICFSLRCRLFKC